MQADPVPRNQRVIFLLIYFLSQVEKQSLEVSLTRRSINHLRSDIIWTLGRPHIDFIQSQLAPSRVLGATNSQPGVSGTPLSHDSKKTRAVTVVFHFPPNWSMTQPHYVNSDQEFFVLDGELEINGTLYRRGDYAYLPAGLAHTCRSSGPGATLLNFYEGEHLAFYEPTPAGMYLPEKFTRKLVADEQPWQASREPAFATLRLRVRENAGATIRRAARAPG